MTSHGSGRVTELSRTDVESALARGTETATVPVGSFEQHGHAGAAETAIVPAIDDGLVRTDELEPGREGEIATARLLTRDAGRPPITASSATRPKRPRTQGILQRVEERYVERVEAERDGI